MRELTQMEMSVVGGGIGGAGMLDISNQFISIDELQEMLDSGILSDQDRMLVEAEISYLSGEDIPHAGTVVVTATSTENNTPTGQCVFTTTLAGSVVGGLTGCALGSTAAGVGCVAGANIGARLGRAAGFAAVPLVCQ